MEGKKPVAKMVGQDGNVFNLMAIARKALRAAGKDEDVTKMTQEVQACGSYDEALSIMSKYVDIE